MCAGRGHDVHACLILVCCKWKTRPILHWERSGQSVEQDHVHFLVLEPNSISHFRHVCDPTVTGTRICVTEETSTHRSPKINYLNKLCLHSRVGVGACVRVSVLCVPVTKLARVSVLCVPVTKLARVSVLCPSNKTCASVSSVCPSNETCASVSSVCPSNETSAKGVVVARRFESASTIPATGQHPWIASVPKFALHVGVYS